jgi:hypothetical protein
VLVASIADGASASATSSRRPTSRSGGSEDLGDQKRESSFVVTVEVVLEDRTTEKVLRTYSFTEREPFSTRAGRVTTLEQAAEEALRDIAERIVYWLETPDPDKT